MNKRLLEDIASEVESSYRGYITLAIIDNKLRDLRYEVEEGRKITFLDTTNVDGLRVYTRTLSFIFIMACKELFGDAKVTIEHSLSKGLYCEVHIDRKLLDEDLESIRLKMDKIIDSNYKIDKLEVTREEA
ncbi:MAG: hypothetical protein ACRC18_11295, partial [Cetobacterium sp.]